MTKDKTWKKVNDMYTIMIGASETRPEEAPPLVYKIFNTDTQVLEAETTILSKALFYANQFYMEYQGVVNGNLIFEEEDDEDDEDALVVQVPSRTRGH